MKTDPLTGDQSVLWNQQNHPNFQTNYTTDYAVNQPQMHQMNSNYQNEGYDEDDRFESTLTHASANNAQAVTTHPQQTPMMVYSNPASQEPQIEYYYPAPPSNTSADDYSNQGAGYESDPSQRSIRRGSPSRYANGKLREGPLEIDGPAKLIEYKTNQNIYRGTSRSANRPYDRPASRSTSRNSNHNQSSSNQIQPAGRGRPAVYKIDFNNLTESQMKTKEKIEDSKAYRNKATEEEKYAYLLKRLQNNEAVRNSRLNKNTMSRDVLNFGAELYHAAQHVRQTIPGVANVESLLEKIDRWEIANNIYFVEKVNDLKPKLNEDNDS